MSFLPDFNLSANADFECGRIYVEDVTSYPLLTIDRDDLGIAIFVSKDGLSTISDYDLSNSEAWYFDVDNGYTYHIKGYVVDKYDSSATYNAGTQYKIVWYDEGNVDHFYMQVATTITVPPGVRTTPTQWMKLEIGETDEVNGGTIDTDVDLYDLFEKSLNTESQDHGWTTTYEAIACSKYYVQKTGCHLWEIVDNSGGTITVDTVRLRRYDHVLLDDELTFTSSVCSIDLSAYEDGDDGVYVVEIWGTEGTETTAEIKASLLIFDLCDAEACYKELFRYVICKCSDPCNDTDCEEQFDIAEKRYDMNMIWGLYSLIEKYVFVDRYQYMGILSISNTREEFITQVGQMVDKLKIVTERCGKCHDDATNDITC